MIFTKTRNKLTIIAFSVLFLQVFGMFNCVDIGCATGGSDIVHHCKFCGMAGDMVHFEQPSDLDQDDSCPCACCIPYTITEFNISANIFAVSYYLIESRLFISTTFGDIDHIPRV